MTERDSTLANPNEAAHSDAGSRMDTRKRAFWIRLVLAALITAMGSGVGLPGWVAALARADHVCTCASGGGHSSCPVCNPAFGALRARSRHTEVRRTPCGEDDRVAFGGAGEFGVLPGPSGTLVARFERVGAGRNGVAWPEMAWVEPPTPPPRIDVA
jgi:hypothetical protein